MRVTIIFKCGLKIRIYYTLRPAVHLCTTTRSQKRGSVPQPKLVLLFQSLKDGGMSCPMAKEGRLRQTYDNPPKDRVVRRSTPPVRKSGSN